MNFRLALAADAPKLASMNRQLIEDEGHRNPMTIAELEHRMHHWLLTGEYQAAVIEKNGAAAPLGYMLFRRDQDYAYLRQLFVDRGHRRRGIGTQAIDWLRENICRGMRLRIEVLVCNRGALEFYRSIGFTDYFLTMEFDPSKHGPMPGPGATT
jgi:ribosomal protein S18 acetylase RimI-like enzyme